jgi:phosphotriesterase-related protein
MPQLSRRSFVQSVGLTALTAQLAMREVEGLSTQAPADTPGQRPGTVVTVRGPVAAADLGVTLVHEHVLVDFVGADAVSQERYERDDAYRRALPFLREVHALGVRTLVECTPAYIGRDPQLLLRLSQATDLHIVTNTGYYGAANDKFVPAHAWAESAEQLAARWTREATDGIGDTEVRPGFMKIGVDSGPLSAIDRKLVEAAALTCKATGLPIAAHTGDGVAAHAEMDVLDSAGVALDAFIWVHAQSEADTAVIVRGAKRGAWVSLDGVSESSADRHIALVVALADAGLLTRVLLSHDAGWYRVGEPGGGEYRPHTAAFSHVLPALRTRLGESAVTQILVSNPARALARR